MKKNAYLSSFSQVDKYSFTISIVILLLAIGIHLVNSVTYQFQGVEYIPPKQMIFSLINLMLIYIGISYLLRANHPFVNALNRFNLFYLVVCTMVIYTTAIQLTPFDIIDPSLLSIDKAMGINTKAILYFTHQHPYLFKSFDWAYDALAPELTLTLLLPAFFYDKRSQSQLIFLLLSSTLIGFTFYYFFPSTAPATLIDSPFFLPEQHSTHVKFDLMHDHLPTTIKAGGLIAMPSYHCIWILICQNYLMRFKWLGYAVMPINLWLMVSCLFLGWHYFADILVSTLIVLSLIALSKKITP